jgi:hypothetical protein
MTASMLVSVDTKVRYKGVEYASLAEIPAEIRRPLDRAVSRLTRGREITPHLDSRIILNGRTVSDPERLSDAERRLIAESLEALLPIDRAIFLAAVKERNERILGVIGLSTIAAGLAAFVGRLWMSGYFAS